MRAFKKFFPIPRPQLPVLALLAVLLGSFSPARALEFGDMQPYFSFIYGDAPPLGGTPGQQTSPNALKLYGDLGPIAGSDWGWGFVLYFHGLVEGPINAGDYYTADLTFDVTTTGGTVSWDFFSELYDGDYLRIGGGSTAVPPSGHVSGVHLQSDTATSDADGVFIDGYLHLDWSGYNPTDTLTLSIPQNSIDVAYQPIPEPGTMALIFAGCGVWAFKRKRLLKSP